MNWISNWFQAEFVKTVPLNRFPDLFDELIWGNPNDSLLVHRFISATDLVGLQILSRNLYGPQGSLSQLSNAKIVFASAWD